MSEMKPRRQQGEAGWPGQKENQSRPVCNPYVVWGLIGWLVIGIYVTVHRKTNEAAPQPISAAEQVYQEAMQGAGTSQTLAR